MTASLSSYPIVLIDKFCSITFSCPPISSTHDSTRELTSLALWSTNHVQASRSLNRPNAGTLCPAACVDFSSRRAHVRDADEADRRTTVGRRARSEPHAAHSQRVGERQRAACASCTFRRSRRPMCSSEAPSSRVRMPHACCTR